jgi:aspartate aminotransferase
VTASPLRGRDIVHQRLAAHPRIRISKPEGALYAFFAVDGMTDSLAFATRLAGEHKVGLAPGVAFGPGGEGHLRLCFASEVETLSRALDRLEVALGR